MPRRNSPTSRANSVARERERQAFELRKSGATVYQIADELGITPQGVSSILKRVLERTARVAEEDAVDVRSLEVERLDAMLLGLWPQARSGHEGTVDRVIRIMQRRADLMGLDAPRLSRSEVTGREGGPIEVHKQADDFSALSVEELEALRDIRGKLDAAKGTPATKSDAAPTDATTTSHANSPEPRSD